MAMVSIINGERAVVMTFLVCILRSLPSSLLIHGIFLSVIGFSALCAEILFETSSTTLFAFQTRPASSGILLGAITLPSLMLCRLVQISRIALRNRVTDEELGYHEVLYWTTSGSTFLLLIFITNMILRSSQKHPSTYFPKINASLFFCSTCALLFLAYHGFDYTFSFLWMLLHGIGSLLLLRHSLSIFPSCASIGESMLVTLGIVLYFGDMLAYTISEIPSLIIPFSPYKSRKEISVLIQGMLFGLLIFPIIFKSLLPLSGWVSSSLNFKSNESLQKSRTVLFFSSLLLICFITPYWMQQVYNFKTHPFLWVAMFVLSEPAKRLSLCMYWIGIIIISVTQFYHISKQSKTERILLRKYYHLLAVLMFLPAVMFQAEFLNLAFGLALSVFLVLETIRIWRIWPLGESLHQFMNCFTDHRDSETLIVSHFSLLLGCALPMWISAGVNDRPLSPFAGILTLGIGDAMASIIGHKYGVFRWSKSGKKTIEGTAAGVTSVLVVCSLLVPVVASSGFFLKNWISLLVAVVLSGLLEAYTSQLDNAFIPLVFYSLLCL